MLGQTLKKLGCCGVLVWLTIAAVFSVFFIMEYLERPDSEKSIWKAGVTVSIGGHQMNILLSKILFSRESIVSGPFWELELD